MRTQSVSMRIFIRKDTYTNVLKKSIYKWIRNAHKQTLLNTGTKNLIYASKSNEHICIDFRMESHPFICSYTIWLTHAYAESDIVTNSWWGKVCACLNDGWANKECVVLNYRLCCLQYHKWNYFHPPISTSSVTWSVCIVLFPLTDRHFVHDDRSTFSCHSC